VHFVDSELVNAMATIGGHVIVFRGLLEVMPHENALSLVMAHEVAHIKHRDPLVALGRSVVMMVGLSMLGLGTGQGAAGEALGQAGLLTQLSFSREQERAADREALAAVARVYGHVRGADTAFEQLMIAAKGGDALLPEAFSSHPETRARIEALRELAVTKGYRAEGKLTAIPRELVAP
jgi:Zn-dependent protease with chaperone function